MKTKNQFYLTFNSAENILHLDVKKKEPIIVPWSKDSVIEMEFVLHKDGFEIRMRD